jgi:hypothetical protein
LDKSGDQFVGEWQEVTALWDQLQARQDDLRSQVLAPALSESERKRLNDLIADLSGQLAQAKSRMDDIIKRARQTRTGRTGDFIVAEMGPSLVSDDISQPADMLVVPRRRES